jgi:hypothetical protein
MAMRCLIVAAAGVAVVTTIGWPPVGGDAGNDYSDGTTSLSLAGTTSGWVMGLVDDSKGWLTSYDDQARPATIMAEVAAEATSLDVAAIGDQLGVAWIDAQSAVHVQLVHANLAALP